MVRFPAGMVVLAASTAWAWDASFQLVLASSEASIRASETSSRGSSDTSDASSRGSRASRASAPQCTTDDDCRGYCDAGTCVDATVPQEPSPPVRPLPGCADDRQCAPGYVCREQRCVEGQRQMIPQCTSDEQCAPGQHCVHGECLLPPPMPPSSSLQRRGSELYLRTRELELRQELALGEGPVITTLASVSGLSAKALGRAMRARRAELIALMGDGSDASWPERFLARVEAMFPRVAFK